jgi:hypothetical protein
MTAAAPRIPLLEQLAIDLADITIRYGAVTASKAIDALPTGHSRDSLLCATVTELRKRGRDGLASQVSAFRFTERAAS